MESPSKLGNIFGTGGADIFSPLKDITTPQKQGIIHQSPPNTPPRRAISESHSVTPLRNQTLESGETNQTLPAAPQKGDIRFASNNDTSPSAPQHQNQNGKITNRTIAKKQESNSKNTKISALTISVVVMTILAGIAIATLSGVGIPVSTLSAKLMLAGAGTLAGSILLLSFTLLFPQPVKNL